ncbi:MAG: methyltransferase [Bacillota bacterium]
MNAHSTMMAYWPARTLQAAVRLGIFDQLARGPQSGAQVAAALGLNPAATERLLQALTSLGWVDQSGMGYANSKSAALTLVSGSPFYVGGAAHHHTEQLWPLWSHLETAVREGRSVMREAFGAGNNPFDRFETSPQEVIKFLAGMHGGAVGLSDALLSAYNFSGHRHLVDVGGATGAVSGPVAQRYPHLRVTVMELPAVARVLPPILQQYGLGDRIAAHAGDFFRPESFPPGFDAALLGRVLHNWSDEKALQILRNIQGALTPGGTVLILESLKDCPDPAGRAFTALSDLTMLVMTGGGRERTGPEYERLLAAAGLRPVATLRGDGPVAVVVGQKPPLVR